MSKLITPSLTGEAKTEYAQAVVEAAELARQLHNKLHEMSRFDLNKDTLQTRMEPIEQLEGELLEHAMRVAIGM